MDEPQLMREPGWVTALADQKAARVAELGPIPYDLVLTPLVDAPEGADLERWERTCDHCGKYVAVGTTFQCGVVAREAHGKRIILGYGACEECLPTP